MIKTYKGKPSVMEPSFAQSLVARLSHY